MQSQRVWHPYQMHGAVVWGVSCGCEATEALRPKRFQATQTDDDDGDDDDNTYTYNIEKEEIMVQKT